MEWFVWLVLWTWLSDSVVVGTPPILTAATTTPRERPNVVVVFADDMGWSDIGCYGSEIPTPNLDRLAQHGLRFTQFYNTGRCSPSRAALLTGQYPHQVGMGHLDNKIIPNHPGYQGKLANTCVTLAEVLRLAGYFTAHTGKWHLGHHNGTPPQVRGFARTLNLAAGGVYYPRQVFKGNSKLYLDGIEKNLDDPLFGEDWYGPELWTQWGLKLIDAAIEQDQPFFLYIGHCSPHFPLMAPAELIEKYRGRYLVGWDHLRAERHARQKQLGLLESAWPLSPLPDQTPAWEQVPEQQKQRLDHIMAIYAAMVEALDTSVGQLVAGLQERGQWEKTLFIFLSDNGGNAESGPNGIYEGDQPGDRRSRVFLGQNWATLSNTPFRRFKHYVHEGGIATPLIVHWPTGISTQRHGTVIDEPGHLVDLMPTICSVTGATYPTEYAGHAILPCEGIDLSPLWAGAAVVREQPLFFEHEGNRAVRAGQWKLVALKGKPWELYNMNRDRTELTDLAATHPEIVARLTNAYQAWADRTAVDENKGYGKKSKRKLKRSEP